MTRSDIPETQQSQYNRNFDFEVQSESGPVVLHGDYIQQGTGSNADFIQMRKRTNKSYEEERIYFYVTEGSYTSVEFEFQHKIVTYSQEDVSGVPAIYSADKIDESNGEEVEIEMELSQDGTMYHCTAELPHGQFRFENVSPSYALYMTYFTAIA